MKINIGELYRARYPLPTYGTWPYLEDWMANPPVSCPCNQAANPAGSSGKELAALILIGAGLYFIFGK